VLDRAQVALAPRLRRVDRDVVDRRAEVGVHRHRQPARARRRLDAVPVLPTVLLVLHRVEEDEAVGCGPLGEVPEPRQVVRLVDRDFHDPRMVRAVMGV